MHPPHCHHHHHHRYHIFGTRWSRRSACAYRNWDTYTVDKHFSFVSSTEARWFCDQHDDWGCYNQHRCEHWWIFGTGGQAARISSSLPGVFYNSTKPHGFVCARQSKFYWHWWTWVIRYRSVCAQAAILQANQWDVMFEWSTGLFLPSFPQNRPFGGEGTSHCDNMCESRIPCPTKQGRYESFIWEYDISM